MHQDQPTERREVWLRANRRALMLGFVPPLFVLALGVALVVGLQGQADARVWRGVGWTLLGMAAIPVAVLLFLWKQPRMAYQSGHLLVFLQWGPPLRLPIDIVECFFLGQGPSLMPEAADESSETVTIIVRLAEAAKEWHHVDVKPSLGHWCDGYVTIRGTWCEPLNQDVAQILNDRLREVHRSRRQAVSRKEA